MVDEGPQVGLFSPCPWSNRGYVHLEVSDTGCGMATESPERILCTPSYHQVHGRGPGSVPMLGILRTTTAASRSTARQTGLGLQAVSCRPLSGGWRSSAQTCRRGMAVAWDSVAGWMTKPCAGPWPGSWQIHGFTMVGRRGRAGGRGPIRAADIRRSRRFDGPDHAHMDGRQPSSACTKWTRISRWC